MYMPVNALVRFILA